MEWKRLLGGCREAVRTIDLPLLVALLILMGVGLAVLHSVSGPGPGRRRFAGGLVAMWLLSRVSLLRLRAWTPALYALSMLPLMAVYVVGTGKYGQRWLNLGVFYLQPSELLKLSLPLMMAWYLHRQPLPPSPRTVLTAAVLIGMPAVLILMQPNLGTATLVTASGVFALLLAGLHWGWWRPGQQGLRWPHLAWFGLLRQYQKDRVLTFLDPAADPLGTGWNILQSRIAIGSGGWQGRGWGQHPGHAGFPARIHHRLRVFGTGRRVRLDRRGDAVRAVPVRGRPPCGSRCTPAIRTHGCWPAALGLAFFVYVLVNGGFPACRWWAFRCR